MFSIDSSGKKYAQKFFELAQLRAGAVAEDLPLVDLLSDLDDLWQNLDASSRNTARQID